METDERRTIETRTTEETPSSFRESPRTVESRTLLHRNNSPWISWGAVFGGLFAGIGTYILLALLGVAAGLSAITPETTQPVGNVPLWTGIWTSISLILSAFVGGYVAARMSGMSRVADGLLHGLVAWGLSTMVFAFLITTSVGSILGGAFSVVARTAGSVVGGAAAGASNVAKSGSAQAQLEALVKGRAGGGTITAQSMTDLRDRFAAGDRDGAISLMVNRMGFTRDRATQVADEGMMLYGQTQNLPQQARQAAASAVSGLSRLTWALFGGVLVSLVLGIAGGVVGSKAADRRRQPLPAARSRS